MTAIPTVGQVLDIGFIKDSLSKYIVSPLNAFGLGGFVFDVEGDSTTNLTADITDHYIEDNSAIQDHIAIRPQRVILRNYVGELVDRRDNTTNTPVQKLTQKLTILNSYLPKLSAGADLFRNTFLNKNAFDITSNINNFSSAALPSVSSVVDIWSAIKNLIPPTSKQQQAYMFFKALFDQKILVSLQTPYEFVTNMAIENITAIQSEDSKYISEFSITLKKIRTVSFQTTPFVSSDFQNRANPQNQTTQNQGNTQGQVTALPGTSNLVQQFFGLVNAPN